MLAVESVSVVLGVCKPFVSDTNGCRPESHKRDAVRKPLVLHVEDEDAIAVLVQFALRELGAAVEWHRVSDAESAFEFLLTENEHGRRPEPDLILLDLNLPKKNGFEILAAIRQNSLLKHIPVVVFTSSAAAVDRQKSLDLGANDYVRKPSTFDGYVTALAKALTLFSREGGEPARG